MFKDLDSIKNETVLVNYFEYQVQTMWNTPDELEEEAGYGLDDFIGAEDGQM